jgi:hypothetical protein
MSCDVAAIAASLWLASTSTAAPPPAAPAVVTTPPSVMAEPLFAGIVQRAGDFEAAIGQLSDLDMQGHVTLVSRGYTDDLKCILKGISQDLPVKLKAVETAADAKARHAALEDMFYLLRDNVEVITAPPQPAA